MVVDEAYSEYVSGIELSRIRCHGSSTFRIWSSRGRSPRSTGWPGCGSVSAVSHPQVAALLNRVRQPFNVNSLGQAAAFAALEDEAHCGAFARPQCAGPGATQATVFRRLASRRHRRPAISCLRTWSGRPRRSTSSCCARGSSSARWRTTGLPQHLRITVGLPEQNERFLRAVAGALGPAGRPGA